VELSATATEEDDGEFGGIMAAGEHAAAVHDDGVIEGGAFAFLNGIESIGDPGELFEEEAVDFEPVRGFLV